METLTVAQQDTLTALARRLHVASLAVNALGADLVHDAVAGTVLDVARDLEAFTVAGETPSRADKRGRDAAVRVDAQSPRPRVLPVGAPSGTPFVVPYLGRAQVALVLAEDLDARAARARTSARPTTGEPPPLTPTQPLPVVTL